MSTETVYQITQAVIFSVGSAGLIIVGLSSWLGKIWASRLMEKDRAIHQETLTKLQSKLEKDATHNNHLLRQKIELYKEVSEPLIILISKAQHRTQLDISDFEEFDASRLSTTALLGMFAPQQVFVKFNEMIDYIYDSHEKKVDWSFNEFRGLALGFLSEVRRDIGLYDDNLIYSGSR